MRKVRQPQSNTTTYGTYNQNSVNSNDAFEKEPTDKPLGVQINHVSKVNLSIYDLLKICLISLVDLHIFNEKSSTSQCSA